MKIYIAQTDGYEGTFVEQYTLSVRTASTRRLNDVRDADLVFCDLEPGRTISSNVQGAVASAVLDGNPGA